MDSSSFIDNLYDQMKQNTNLSGEFEKNQMGIHWKLPNRFCVEIGCNYIGIGRMMFKDIPHQITHWHPDDEIYDDICKIGTKGNVTVIHNSLLGESVVYSGSQTDCKYKRKWLFGKYYYIYAE